MYNYTSERINNIVNYYCYNGGDFDKDNLLEENEEIIIDICKYRGNEIEHYNNIVKLSPIISTNFNIKNDDGETFLYILLNIIYPKLSKEHYYHSKVYLNRFYLLNYPSASKNHYV